jgi:hypothetical protein
VALAGIAGSSASAYAQQYHPAAPGYAPYPAMAANYPMAVPAQYTVPYAMPPVAYQPMGVPMSQPMPMQGVVQGPVAGPAPVTQGTLLETETSHELAGSVAHGGCDGCDGCRSEGCSHCCAYKCSGGRCVHRTGAFGEYLFLQARGVDLAYAVPQDGIGGLGTVPIGRVGTTNFDNDSGYRAGFTVAIDCCSSVTLTYTSFESDIEDITTSDIVIQPLVAFPGTFNVGFTSQLASALNHIEFQFIDADFKAIWLSGKNYYLNYVLGGRYANMDQEFEALFPFAPPNGTTFVEADVEFDGGGIRFGIEGERMLCACHGLGVYGKFIGSLVAGKSRASYQQINQFNGVEATTTWEDSRVVPIVETEVGVSWVSPSGLVRISGGYYVACWSNIVSVPEYIDAVQNMNYVDVAQDSKDTITFDGLVARLEISL